MTGASAEEFVLRVPGAHRTGNLIRLDLEGQRVAGRSLNLSAWDITSLSQSDGFVLIDIQLDIPVMGTLVSTQVAKMTITLESGLEVHPRTPLDRDRILLMAETVIDSFFQIKRPMPAKEVEPPGILSHLPVGQETIERLMAAGEKMHRLAEDACAGTGISSGDLILIICREAERREAEQKNEKSKRDR